MPIVYSAMRRPTLPFRWLSRGVLTATGAFLLSLSTTPPSATASVPRVARPVRPNPAASGDSIFWRLRGQVLDAYTEEPLPQAALWLKQLAIGTHTDEQGFFSFDLTADQLAATPADTLQVTAGAFRLHSRALDFQLFSPDSVLRVVLLRDSALVTHAPVLAAQGRGRRATRPLPVLTDPMDPAPPSAPAGHRSFWKRLFGRQ